MKRFLIQVTVFAALIATSAIAVVFLAGGSTDEYYVRFTTPRQGSMIIGSSRAAQGLQPDVFKEQLGLDIFNYAFTVAQSPFGPTYLNSIKLKYDESSEKGVFIVAVDPWVISSRTENPNDSANFREVNLCLGNTKVVDMDPNPYYLLENYSGKYYELLLPKGRSMFLHQDGWLEVTVPMDSAEMERKVQAKVKKYEKDNLPFYKFSTLRFDYLAKTIAFLKEHGDVYLVRLPVHPSMMELENRLMPDFNEKMQEVVPMASGYLDMTDLNDQCTYTDGNHLEKSSGKIVSEKVAIWIGAMSSQSQ